MKNYLVFFPIMLVVVFIIAFTDNTDTSHCVVLGGSILTLMFVGGMWRRNIEKRLWNNGVSEKTGEPWNCFDMDSSGARMYKSGNRLENGVMEAYCTCSYRVDDDYNDIAAKRYYKGRKGHVINGTKMRD